MTTHGTFTFDAHNDGDNEAFTYSGPVAGTTVVTGGTAGRWNHDTNATPSSNVGPDNGQGGSPDGYLYTEMTSQSSGDVWTMEFDTDLDASAESWEFDYYWCGRGDACEFTIQVQTNENGAGWVDRGAQTGFGDETIPGTSGATTWFNKTVDLAGLISDASTRVRIEITCTANPTSQFWHNDVGIDTVTITGTVLGGTYEQDSFRGRNDDGSESAATWKAAANTNWSNLIDENVRIRFLIEETDDVAEDDVEFQLQYNLNAGGWNNVTGASSVAQSSASSNVADAANTTEQLSGPGTFITTNAGFDEVNGIAGGTALDFTVTVNQEVEVEYCIQIQGADVDDADTIQFRVAKDGSAINAYTNTPTVTVEHANYDQASFRAKNDTGGITSTDWKADLNTNWNQSVDENVRVRFLIQETRDVADANRVFQLQYNHNGGGWLNVTGSSLVARATASPNVTDGVDTTQQLGSGTFLTSNDGFDEVDGAVGGAALDFTSTANQEVELEFCLQIRSADVAQNDSVQLRVIGTGGGGAVNAYTNTPLLTARIPQAFVMSNSANLTNGEVTTQQLTAGSGTFVDGRVEESTSQSVAEVEVSASDYTEYEFCIQRTSQSSPSTQYQFRLADERAIGELLNDYAVDPRVTTSA